MGEHLLTLHDIATHLQVVDRTVKRLLEEDPDFPRPFRAGGRDRWELADLREWEKLQKYKAVLITRGWTPPDSTGQSRTNGPEGQNPPARRKGRG